MQEILKKLTELVGICETRVNKLEHEKSELAGLRGTLEKQKSDQDIQEKNIQEELDALNKKKAVVKTLEEAQTLLKNNNEEKKRIRVESDKFEQSKKDFEKSKNEALADLQRQKDKCAALTKETEKKSENYRVEVMNQILKESASKANK